MRSGVELRRSWLIVAGAIAVAAMLRLALVLWSVCRGFVEYNADGFSRIIRGYEWLQAPRWEVEVWLPLHFWLYGLVLAVWDNIFLAPKLLNLSFSLLTILVVYGIAARLSDRRAGVIAAMLVAVFPYEVWLSFSGMSEPLFHFLVVFGVFGFACWWTNWQEWLLIPAAFSLAAATAVRYEGWFYVAIFVAVVLTAAWHHGRDLRLPLLGSVIAVSFMAIWLQQNYQLFGDPFAFVRHTEEIRFVEDPANIEAGFIDRLFYFPQRAFETAPLMIVLGIIASGYALYSRFWRWAGFTAIVAFQAVLFMGVTAPFASLGPGAERFLLSNVILMSVPIAAAMSALVDRYGQRGLVVGTSAAILLLVSFAPDWRNPPDHYPARDTQELGETLERYLNENPGGYVVVLLPRMPDERFNEGYALRVLSGEPEQIEITDAPSRLYEAVQEGEAAMWVMDQRIEANRPPAEESFSIGNYEAGHPPPPAYAEADVDNVEPGESIAIDASGFVPEETISTWWTGPDGDVFAGPEITADEAGQIEEEIPLPGEARHGRWALTLSGQRSERQAFVSIEVVP